MDRVRQTIELKDGVAVELLVTPALYAVAKRRGIDPVADANAGDVTTSYIKVIYCAAILAWEVAAVDDPKRGEFPYKYGDFFAWAWADQERFSRALADVYEALTGKKLEAEAVKKKGGRHGSSR